MVSQNLTSDSTLHRFFYKLCICCALIFKIPSLSGQKASCLASLVQPPPAVHLRDTQLRFLLHLKVIQSRIPAPEFSFLSRKTSYINFFFFFNNQNFRFSFSFAYFLIVLLLGIQKLSVPPSVTCLQMRKHTLWKYEEKIPLNGVP